MMAEAFARSFGVPVVILRPFNTYGPRQSERAVIPAAIRQMLDPACEEIRLGDLTPTRDFCFVGDTAAAFLAAGAADGLDHGVPYNAGTGVAVSIGDMVEAARRVTGCAKPLSQEARRLRPEQSEVRALLADPARFHAATGWRAATTLDDGLASTVDWWQRRIQAGRQRATRGYIT